MHLTASLVTADECLQYRKIDGQGVKDHVNLSRFATCDKGLLAGCLTPLWDGRAHFITPKLCVKEEVF